MYLSFGVNFKCLVQKKKIKEVLLTRSSVYSGLLKVAEIIIKNNFFCL